MSVRLAVFASGGGSNLQAMIDRFGSGEGPVRMALVISDRADARALERARSAGIYATVIEVRNRPLDFVTRETLAALDGADIDLIALAGYVQLVPPAVVKRYRDRILNIHPALLPSFGGKGMYGAHVHRAVLDSGCSVSGATVHYVNETYDEGRVLAQWPVPVVAGDSPETLAARVLKVEHILFPAAIELLAHSLSRGAPLVRDEITEAAFVQIPQPAPTAADVRRALGID